MPTRNVVLTDRQQRLVEELVSTGEYQNASEVLREGLRLIEARRNFDREKLDLLRALAQQGWDDESGSRYIDLDEDQLAKGIAQLRFGPRITRA
ncbi:MAG: type II toxin-antitoxin system ParD family antitoxin [Microthrixaceae bacterium]